MENHNNNKSSEKAGEKHENKSQGAYIKAKKILVRDSGKFSSVKVVKY